MGDRCLRRQTECLASQQRSNVVSEHIVQHREVVRSSVLLLLCWRRIIVLLIVRPILPRGIAVVLPAILGSRPTRLSLSDAAMRCETCRLFGVTQVGRVGSGRTQIRQIRENAAGGRHWVNDAWNHHFVRQIESISADDVVPGTAIHPIGAVTASENIIAGRPVQFVIAIRSIDFVVATTTEDHDVVKSTVQHRWDDNARRESDEVVPAATPNRQVIDPSVSN